VKIERRSPEEQLDIPQTAAEDVVQPDSVANVAAGNR